MKIEETTWRGLPAVAIHDAGRTAILGLIGAQLASLRLDHDHIEPMWQPTWPAADPYRLDATQLAYYGGGPDAPLLAAACGSFPCCDRFGPPPAGMEGTTHGAAAIAHYDIMTANAQGVVLSAQLDQAGLEIRRRFAFVGEELELSTTVCHRDATIRALDWCEHTTLGGDFLDDAVITAAIDRTVTFPELSSIEPSKALGMPATSMAPCGAIVAGRISGGWWSVEGRQSHRRLTCTFNSADWPWLTIWTEHHSRTHAPWHGDQRARGMELSNRPFPVPHDPLMPVQPGGTPSTLTEIPPGEGTTRSLRLRWETC